jgi:hypothetical protein
MKKHRPTLARNASLCLVLFSCLILLPGCGEKTSPSGKTTTAVPTVQQPGAVWYGMLSMNEPLDLYYYMNVHEDEDAKTESFRYGILAPRESVEGVRIGNRAQSIEGDFVVKCNGESEPVELGDVFYFDQANLDLIHMGNLENTEIEKSDIQEKVLMMYRRLEDQLDQQAPPEAIDSTEAPPETIEIVFENT